MGNGARRFNSDYDDLLGYDGCIYTSGPRVIYDMTSLRRVETLFDVSASALVIIRC